MLLYATFAAHLTLHAAAAPTPQGLAYYQRGLPAAKSLVAQAIPEDMLTPLDAGNNSYFEALDKDGKRCGYLRDFVGPVSGADACPCSPLRFTLVLDQNAQFTTLISPEPLQKYGHVQMTPQEQARLVALVKDPPKALMAVPRVEGMVDATTGATRLPLKDVVVPQAALSTRRIAGIVRDTLAILQGAPAGRDRQRLRAILQDPQTTEAERCAKLATLLPSCESDDLREQAYRILGNQYALSLQHGGSAQSLVEQVLLKPPVPRAQAGTLLAGTCNQLADRGLCPDFVNRCVDVLTGPNAPPVPRGDVALLRGTALFQAGKMAEAEPPLRAATRRYPVQGAPVLYQRLAQAQAAIGQSGPACTTARSVMRWHPLMPGAEAALQSCVPPASSLEAVRTEVGHEAQQAILSGVLQGRGAAPKLDVDDDAGKAVQLDLAAPDTITIALFFATWCPHCRAELPRVKSFVAAMPEAVRKRVRVLGIRTAVERETEPYAAFTAAVAPNFPIYTDSTMSLAFVKFAEHAGISAGLPTTAVLDAAGEVRYLLDPGDWRDTAQELRWVVDAELQRAAKDM